MSTQVAVLTANNPHIVSVKDNSDAFTKRALVHFDNGYSLSVINGSGSYGGRSGLFEIAVFDPQGEWVTLDNGDVVMGWQSDADVIGWINKVAEM